MTSSLTLGRLRGIPIRAHFTLLFLIPYIAYLMAARFDAVSARAGVDGTPMLLPPVIWGPVLAVGILVGILLHELGHSLLALRHGGRVRSITLMLLGGVSEIEGMPQTPRSEGLIAVAGPAVSLLLGGVALALSRLIPGPPDLRFGFFCFAQINLAVGIFNLLPAFPMDGGRVLRALIGLRWSRRTATRVSAAVGSLFAAAFVALGLTSGNFLLAIIGVFVWSGARSELELVERQETLRGLFVRDVMEPTSATVQLSEPAAEAAARMAQSHTTALPVLDGTDLVGIVAAHHLEMLRPEERAVMPMSAVVARQAPLLDSDDTLTTALESMAEHHVEEAPVVHLGHVVGVMETSDLARMARLRRLSAAPLPTQIEDART
jgi:Zn-dependent protease/predicted transcriptional regulator